MLVSQPDEAWPEEQLDNSVFLPYQWPSDPMQEDIVQHFSVEAFC